MTTIKLIFERFGAQYQDRWADKMPEVHQKTIEAIVNCRSGHYDLSMQPVRHIPPCAPVLRQPALSQLPVPKIANVA